MTYFLVFMLAVAVGVPGPARPVHINREQIVTVRSIVPIDPQRPGARSIVRTEGGGVLYVAELPQEVVRAPCEGRAHD